MGTITKDTISTLAPGQGVLAALRALAASSSGSITDALHAADKQAELLRDLLPNRADQLMARLSDLIPSILVEHIDDMPVPGTSFWGKGQWHIHVRTSEPVGVRQFTVLHELKHIIDHPVRRQRPDLLGNADWERLADRFAGRVLKRDSDRTTSNYDSTNRQHISHQSITGTGG